MKTKECNRNHLNLSFKKRINFFKGTQNNAKMAIKKENKSPKIAERKPPPIPGPM
jgi:hypothetical protein